MSHSYKRRCLALKATALARKKPHNLGRSFPVDPFKVRMKDKTRSAVLASAATSRSRLDPDTYYLTHAAQYFTRVVIKASFAPAITICAL